MKFKQTMPIRFFGKKLVSIPVFILYWILTMSISFIVFLAGFSGISDIGDYFLKGSGLFVMIAFILLFGEITINGTLRSMLPINLFTKIVARSIFACGFLFTVFSYFQ